MDDGDGGHDVDVAGDVGLDFGGGHGALGCLFNLRDQVIDVFAGAQRDVHLNEGARPVLGEVGDRADLAVGDGHHLAAGGAQLRGAEGERDDGALHRIICAFEAHVVTDAELALGDDENTGEEVPDDVLRAETNRGGNDCGGDGSRGSRYAEQGEGADGDDEVDHRFDEVHERAGEGELGFRGLLIGIQSLGDDADAQSADSRYQDRQNR